VLDLLARKIDFRDFASDHHYYHRCPAVYSQPAFQIDLQPKLEWAILVDDHPKTDSCPTKQIQFASSAGKACQVLNRSMDD